jgi:transcription antitermination protein NusB
MAQGKRQPALNKRRAARFAAVQALYQAEAGELSIDRVIAEFKAHRLGEIFEPLELATPSPKVDEVWFAIVAGGAWVERDRLDPAIESCLREGWSLTRCGYLLRATLRAGAFELAKRTDVPVNVVINEYVELAHLFFNGDEPSLVNAVLDRLGPMLRTDPEAVL